jgi:cytochrome c peroxidase
MTAMTAMTAVALARPLPPGFPAPLVPADNPMNPARVTLGEQLFGDRRLSVTGEYACVSCHDPVRAFSDAQPRAVGALGDKLRRNAPSILYSAWNPSLGWDPPGSPALEKQMLTPLYGKHPVELGLSGIESRVLAQLQADGALRSSFEEAFPGERQPVTLDNVVRAIASYERSLGEGSSAFDRYVFDADRSGMGPSALRGLELFFNSRLGCVDCHSGMAFSGSLRSVAQPDEAPRFADNGRGTEGPARVPSLRNVAVTAPYMRDGTLPTLAAVIDHYDRGSPGVQPPLPALHLTEGEKADLQAFLESLTDRPYEALLSRP